MKESLHEEVKSLLAGRGAAALLGLQLLPGIAAQALHALADDRNDKALSQKKNSKSPSS